MKINESYVRGMHFFLHCAVTDGLLAVTESGTVIPDKDGVVRIRNKQWLMDNSPTYFKYNPKSGSVVYKTPEQALKTIWKELGYKKK